MSQWIEPAKNMKCWKFHLNNNCWIFILTLLGLSYPVDLSINDTREEKKMLSLLQNKVSLHNAKKEKQKRCTMMICALHSPENFKKFVNFELKKVSGGCNFDFEKTNKLNLNFKRS